MSDLRPAARMPLLGLGMLSLLGGVLAGLARLDWNMPATAANAAGWHGALMISAFLGTVISLERAVALARGWPYAAPAAAGIGGIALLVGAPLIVTQALMVIAAATLVAASLQVLRRLVAPFTVILAVGAVCWLIGNLASLALRILGGLGDNFALRSEGGLLNAIALLLFMVTMMVSVLRGSRETATQGSA